MKKTLDNPDLEVVKKAISSGATELEIAFKNKLDNIEEFVIFHYLINELNFSFEKVNPIDDSKQDWIAIFKKKS